MAELLRDRDAVNYGLTVMGYELFTRFLPARLEGVLGVRGAAVIIASVAEEGARSGFRAFLERLGVRGVGVEDVVGVL